LAGDLDPAVGQGPHLRQHARPPGRDPRGPERAHDHRAGAAVGSPLRVGVIGVGVISAQYFAAFPRLANLRLAAVADLNMDRAREVAAEQGVQALTVDELLTSPDVDVVLNLTIPAAHVE